MYAVEARNVSKAFRGRPALSQVDLSIREGEIQGLLGPNGAGKTTLIAILAGLTAPDQGRVEICGRDVARELHRVQGLINMVRGFSGVLEKFTARELLNYYAMLYDAPAGRVAEVLRRAGLWERRDQEVANFSSGWRQRFFIAKGLLNAPRVLFLDEPTVGLDLDAALALRDLVREINRQGCTILLTTHYMREAEELCGRIALIFLGLGRVMFQFRPPDPLATLGGLLACAACGLVLAVFSLGIAFLKRGDAFAFIFAFPDVIAVVSGVFYSTSVFPAPVQALARILPTTHAFDLLKATLGLAPARPGLFLATLLPWAAVAVLFTTWVLARARRDGKLVKMK